MTLNDIVIKLLRVINDCTRKEQLPAARKYMDLCMKRYNLPPYYIETVYAVLKSKEYALY